MTLNNEHTSDEGGLIIDRIQTQLEYVYNIGVPERVKNYLIDKHEVQNLLTTSHPDTLPKELLLVRQQSEEDTVEVALFLDQKLLSNLKNNNPFISLNNENLADLCILIEGVSHFVYFLWKAYQETPITQLEMELQAEIDKYVMLSLFLRSDQMEEISPLLFHQLFDDFKLANNLTIEAKERYLTASHLASRYCNHLRNKFNLKNDISHLLNEIRFFYKLSQEQKISHIQN